MAKEQINEKLIWLGEQFSDWKNQPGYWDVNQAFIHTNDHGYGQNLNILRRIAKPSTPLSISLIVGSGGLPSTLLDYRTDVILVVDNNRFQLACLEQRLFQLEQAHNVEQYFNAIYTKENTLFTNVNMAGILQSLKTEIQILKQRHILTTSHTNPRFQECQQAVVKPVFLTICDLSKKTETLRLAHILNETGSVITITNFTNLGDYCRGTGLLEESLPNFLFDKNVAILYSHSNKAGVTSEPLAFGLEQYLKSLI